MLVKILDTYSCFANNLLLKRTVNDLDTTLKSILNEFSRLTAFDSYESPAQLYE